MNEFWVLFLGEVLTPVSLAAGFVMSLMGMYLQWFFKTIYAMKYKEGTPKKFSLSYSIKDNWLKKLLTGLAIIIIIFVTYRFPVEFVGATYSMFYAFVVGLGIDWVIDRWFKISKKPPILNTGG